MLVSICKTFNIDRHAYDFLSPQLGPSAQLVAPKNDAADWHDWTVSLYFVTSDAQVLMRKVYPQKIGTKTKQKSVTLAFQKALESFFCPPVPPNRYFANDLS